MESFLPLKEYRFAEMELPTARWGDLLGEYLEWEALQFWAHLRQTDMDITNWYLMRRELVQRFCLTDRAVLIRQMVANKWTVDHRAHVVNFSKIVAKGA